MLEKRAWEVCSSILPSLQLLCNCNNSCVSGRISPQGCLPVLPSAKSFIIFQAGSATKVVPLH